MNKFFPFLTNETVRKCCKYFNIGNIIYKNHYLPSKEEYIEHGYPGDTYESFLTNRKKEIDEHPESYKDS